MEHSQITRFTNLWTKVQNSVFAVICSAITNFADAEDVLQKVSSVAVTKFETFDRNGDSRAFAAWVFAIARFEILRHVRDRGTDRHEFIADSIAQITTAFEEIAPEFDTRRNALAQCRKQIKGRAKEALECRYGEGLKTGAIAERLGMTSESVSVVLNRAYRRLRECIESRLSAGTDLS